MDILYVLGRGSEWDNNEIKYSLRSIEKYGKNVDRVYVVGYNPGFLSDEVTFISCEDMYDKKHKNILGKILYAIEHSDIGEEFLLSSDDHFYVKETDFDNYPYYYKGILPNKVPRVKDVDYHTSLVQTRRLLENRGFPCYMFNWHGNTHFTRKGIERAREVLNKGLGTKYGGETNCIVGNISYFYDHFPIVEREDLKVGSTINNKEDLIKLIGDRECFSIYNSAIERGVREYLEELFPEKSVYEK